MGFMGRKPVAKPLIRRTVAMDEELWRTIVRYQTDKRISTPSEAARLLLWAGLDAAGVEPQPPEPEPGRKRKGG